MLKDWKSSASGILSFLSITFAVVTAWLGSYMITAPASSQALLAKISGGLSLATALVRGYIGLITTNADAGAVAAALAPPPATPATLTPPVIPTAASLAATPKP